MILVDRETSPCRRSNPIIALAHFREGWSAARTVLGIYAGTFGLFVHTLSVLKAWERGVSEHSLEVKRRDEWNQEAWRQKLCKCVLHVVYTASWLFPCEKPNLASIRRNPAERLVIASGRDDWTKPLPIHHMDDERAAAGYETDRLETYSGPGKGGSEKGRLHASAVQRMPYFFKQLSITQKPSNLLLLSSMHHRGSCS